jgi:hypothetical protein
MGERCDYKPVLDRSGGREVSCPPNLLSAFKKKADCSHCPKNKGATIFYTTEGKEGRLGSVAAKDIREESIRKTYWYKNRTR